jgi:simple sugar transport system permease protein
MTALAGPAALLLMLAAATVWYPAFAPSRVVPGLLASKAHLGIVALGLTWVVLAGGIDLSVGSLAALAAMVVAKAVGVVPLWAALAAGPVLGLLFGLAQGALIRAGGLPPFIVTLAGMFLAHGLALSITEDTLSISSRAHAALAAFEIGIGPVTLGITALVYLSLLACMVLIDAVSPVGVLLRAVGDDAHAAAAAGLPVARLAVGTYAWSGSCAGLAGAVLTLYVPSVGHDATTGMELDAIAAVIVGGTAITGGRGSIPGTAVGVLTVSLAMLLPTYQSGLTPGVVRVVIGGLLLAFVLLQAASSRWLTPAGAARGA